MDYSKDGGIKLLWNISTCIPIHKVSYARKLDSSSVLLREHGISQLC